MTDSWPRQLRSRPLCRGDAEKIASWRYDGPWRVYNPRPDAPLGADDAYWTIVGAETDQLVGFCCAGAEARVPGLGEEPGLLDVGLGLDPAWVGRGHGLQFGQAVIDHFRQEYPGLALRAVVQSWNHRSMRLTRRLGFVDTGRHTCRQHGHEVDYTVLVTK